MKKLIIILVALSLTLLSLPVLASTITDAYYYGTIIVSNNSTAATEVSVNFTCNTTALINAGYINSGANNTAIRSAASADLAYMPGYNGNPWVVWVPSIGAETYLNDILYVGGGDMQAELAYFPSVDGMTITDTATLEPGLNYNISQRGYIDTTAVGANLTNKNEAIRVYISSAGNITAASSSVEEYYTDMPGDSWDINVKGVTWRGQTFTTASDYEVDGVYLRLFRFGNPGTITLSIRATSGGLPTGADLTSASSNGNTLTTDNSGEIKYLDLTNYDLSASTKYALVLRAPAGDASNYVCWHFDNTSPTYSGGAYISSGDSGSSWAENTDRDFYFSIRSSNGGVITASGVSSGVHTVNVTCSGATMRLWVDDVQQGTSTTYGIPDVSSNWTFVDGGSMSYMEWQRIYISGTLRQHIEWQYADTFTDYSGNGHNVTPSFRTTSSDPDVSAALSSFIPIAEADAPAYTLENPPDFLDTTPTASGNFTTTVNATYPGHGIMTAIAIAGGVPERLPTTIMFTLLLLIISFGISAMLRQHGSGALNIKAFVVFAAMCVFVAFRVYDPWQVYFFGIMALGIMWLSRQREAY